MQEVEALREMNGVAFERVLDQALNSPEIAAAVGRADATLTRERLRTEAIEARTCLTGAADAEYGHYIGLKASPVESAGDSGPADASTAAVGTGQGLGPTLAVLVPSLVVVAVGAYLLCGFGTRTLHRRPHFDDGLAIAGVIGAAVIAGAAVGNLVWLLLAARRPSVRDDESDESDVVDGHDGTDGDVGDEDPEVQRAREAWERALLERGVMPFLRSRLD